MNSHFIYRNIKRSIDNGYMIKKKCNNFRKPNVKVCSQKQQIKISRRPIDVKEPSRRLIYMGYYSKRNILTGST